MKRILTILSLSSLLLLPVQIVSAAPAPNVAALDGETAAHYDVSRPGYAGQYGIVTPKGVSDRGRYRADIDFVVDEHKVRAMIMGQFRKDKSDSSLLIVAYKDGSWLRMTGHFEDPIRVVDGQVKEPLPLAKLVTLALSSPYKKASFSYGTASVDYERQTKPFPIFARLPEFFAKSQKERASA